MDPNETLRMVREAIRKVGFHYDRADKLVNNPEMVAAHNALAAEYALEMVDSVRELDEWLSKGGYLPHGWKGDR